MKVKVCVGCEKALPPLRLPGGGRKFCGPECRAVFEKRFRERGLRRSRGVSCATVGAIYELVVAADLMDLGYHVFRCLSPSGSCDLVALHENVVMRVEVGTGVKTSLGNVSSGKHIRNVDRRDLLALVADDGTIHYYPKKPPPTYSPEGSGVV